MDIRTVENFACGSWSAPDGPSKEVMNPSNGTIIAKTGTRSSDIESMLHYARTRGGPALREMTIHQRARMLKAVAIELDRQKSRLYALNALTGATRKDGWYDIDGGIMTVFAIASKGRREMPDSHVYLDGGIEQLSRNGTFLGQHVAVPLTGAAIHVNAFNFPVWGMLEKLAPTLLAGMPAIVKSASVTSYLAEECVRIILESGLLPEGAIQFIGGEARGIAGFLGVQDVLSFTGSCETGELFRAVPGIRSGGVRFVAEQDSLNATILGPDSGPDTKEFDLFVNETVSEMVTKAGQKCTAIRRIIVPKAFLSAASDAISSRLSEITVGDPERSDIDMGPLVSEAQLRDVAVKASQIAAESVLLCGDEPNEPIGRPGAFMLPTLFRCDSPDTSRAVHELEAFGPVACIMPCSSVEHAAAIANRGGGSLVTSAYTIDPMVCRKIVLACAPWNGRIYFNNRESGDEATGHGSPLPHMIHGGPGRAGGSAELGGVRGVLNYMQRTAIQGHPDVLTGICGQWIKGSERRAPASHPFRIPFDDLAIGDSVTTRYRTVSSHDIEHFAAFTGDRFYAHMDDAAASRNPFFPGRVAHGYLLLSFAAGLFVDPDEGPVLANTGLSELSFQKPVVPGERIRAILTVKRKTKRTEDYGEVRWDVSIENDESELVAEYELRTMNAYGASSAE